jgi:hypothetical protein
VIQHPYHILWYGCCNCQHCLWLFAVECASRMEIALINVSSSEYSVHIHRSIRYTAVSFSTLAQFSNSRPSSVSVIVSLSFLNIIRYHRNALPLLHYNLLFLIPFSPTPCPSSPLSSLLLGGIVQEEKSPRSGNSIEIGSRPHPIPFPLHRISAVCPICPSIDPCV